MSITVHTAFAPPVHEPCQGFITDLVLRCGQEDEAALGDLFDLIFFLVAALLGRSPLSSSAIDDEIVEVFWRIWRRSTVYEPAKQDVLAWVIDQVLDGQESGSSLDRHLTDATP